MHTGDGIRRVSDVESLSTPDGGEGGSVLQALGSEAEVRAKRRKKKKDSYALYLESPTWKKIRAAALKRDRRKCRACGDRATVVHHIRYPKNLGQEKMEWLFSMCVPCHDSIHRAATKMTLKAATNLILTAGGVGTENVTYLSDDWQLSKSATKARQRRKMRKQPKKKRKRVVPQHVKDNARKKSKTEKENDRLHAVFKQNREYRERRWGNATR